MPRKRISFKALRQKNAHLQVEHIHIGEFLASKQPMVIKTLLGSCVSVCLYDFKNNIGGMNHILVPGKARMDDFNAASRFGINAMELLINALFSLGAQRKSFVAKVFGGAHVTPGLSAAQAVGKKNAQFVLAFLHRENITVKAQDLGGHSARIIYYHTHTGNVFLKRRPSLKSSQLSKLELEHQSAVHRQLDLPTDVVIFKPEE